MEKLTKENIYISLQGKSKEELTELWELVKDNLYTDFRLNSSNAVLDFEEGVWIGSSLECVKTKQEVTIQQLKEILQPMEKFTPIAMKCTQEQFEAIKPKLQGLNTDGAYDFEDYNYLLNVYNCEKNRIGTTRESSVTSEVKIHEEWNEEIFLKACGIEVDTLEQQLEKAEAEVKRLKEAIEDSRPKNGDWVVNNYGVIWRCSEVDSKHLLTKITCQELINKLNELIK